MTEFKEALGKDKGTLKGLTGALEMCGDDNEHSLAHDVKEVAKRLSERSENNIQQVRKLFFFVVDFVWVTGELSLDFSNVAYLMIDLDFYLSW